MLLKDFIFMKFFRLYACILTDHEFCRLYFSRTSTLYIDTDFRHNYFFVTNIPLGTPTANMELLF